MRLKHISSTQMPKATAAVIKAYQSASIREKLSLECPGMLEAGLGAFVSPAAPQRGPMQVPPPSCRFDMGLLWTGAEDWDAEEAPVQL